jgi:hypothetical protein
MTIHRSCFEAFPLVVGFLGSIAGRFAPEESDLRASQIITDSQDAPECDGNAGGN